MAPVFHDPQLCRLIELEDGTYDINHLADFHEAMAERREYRRRSELAAKRPQARPLPMPTEGRVTKRLAWNPERPRTPPNPTVPPPGGAPK